MFYKRAVYCSIGWITLTEKREWYCMVGQIVILNGLSLTCQSVRRIAIDLTVTWLTVQAGTATVDVHIGFPSFIKVQ